MVHVDLPNVPMKYRISKHLFGWPNRGYYSIAMQNADSTTIEPTKKPAVRADPMSGKIAIETVSDMVRNVLGVKPKRPIREPDYWSMLELVSDLYENGILDQTEADFLREAIASQRVLRRMNKMFETSGWRWVRVIGPQHNER